MNLSIAKALAQARAANAAIHPGNYLEHHLTMPLDQRQARAEAFTNRFERLLLGLNAFDLGVHKELRKNMPKGNFQSLNMNIWRLNTEDFNNEPT